MEELLQLNRKRWKNFTAQQKKMEELNLIQLNKNGAQKQNRRSKGDNYGTPTRYALPK